MKENKNDRNHLLILRFINWCTLYSKKYCNLLVPILFYCSQVYDHGSPISELYWCCRQTEQGMEGKTIFPFSVLGNFFHSIFNFFSIFHSILPYQSKFGPEATLCLYCTFVTLSVPSQVVACEGKPHVKMHLIPYLKHDHNELP